MVMMAAALRRELLELKAILEVAGNLEFGQEPTHECGRGLEGLEVLGALFLLRHFAELLAKGAAVQVIDKDKPFSPQFGGGLELPAPSWFGYIQYQAE